MSDPVKPPLFLAKSNYRQRRLRDAARLIPLLGVVLWVIPLAWTDDGPNHRATLVYVFAVWVALIVMSAAISHFLRDNDASADDQPQRKAD